MFGAASDLAAGIPVVNEPYPDGEAGIQKSLRVMCRKIREGMATAVMKSFAGNVLKEYGFPNGTLQRTAALLDFIRKHVAYAPDALGTEQVQSAAITLCVAGAPVCIPVGDCDDLVTALGTLVGALGMECRVVRQIFGGDAQQHVLLEVKDERGKWLAADPTSKTMPVGKKAFAQNETYCSPWDPEATGLSDAAQFVGIGSLPAAPLPVLMLTHGAWHAVDHLPQRRGLGGEVFVEIAPGIEVDQMTGDIHVGLGHGEDGACCNSCAKGGPCEGCGGKTGEGVGGPIDDTIAALKFNVDVVGASKQLWAQMQGRSWDQAISLADSRAESKSWGTDLSSQADLTTLLISSALNVYGLDKKSDPQSRRASDALTRTFQILLKRIGRAPSQGASVQQYSNNATGNAGVPIGIVIVLGITVAVIYVAAITYIYFILRDCLASAATTYTCDREMMRLHSEVDKIVDNRMRTGGSYSADELQRIADLEAAQQRVLDGCVDALKPPPPPKGPFDLPWGTIAVGAGIVGLAVLGVVYAPEIKHALSPRARE